MRITQEQLDLIARTYDVVLEPEAWPEVLQGFSDQVRARATNVIVADHANPEVRIAAVSGGIPIALTGRVPARLGALRGLRGGPTADLPRP